MAGCRKLKELILSNQFSTEDFAYLSVNLPKTKCRMFAPYVPIDSDVLEEDVMVVGIRKPVLDSKRDIVRLKKYEEDFARLQAGFAAPKKA